MRKKRRLKRLRKIVRMVAEENARAALTAQLELAGQVDAARQQLACDHIQVTCEIADWREFAGPFIERGIAPSKVAAILRDAPEAIQ
jgi:hypothetical protein